MKLRIFFIATRLVILAAVFQTDLADAGRLCHTVDPPGPANSYRTCEDGWDVEGGDLVEIDCRFGECNVCGVCHADPGQKVKQKYPAVSHIAKYKYDIKADERIQWSHSTYLTTVSGRKCIMRDGRQIHCFSSNAVVVMNPQGQPVGIVTPASQPRPTTPKTQQPIGPVKPVVPPPAIPRK